jgi:two-component system, OmpR family, osmolarity sensor histidine kinase EnvZ
MALAPPRSLLWRVFLLIAAVIVLAIGAWVQIFRAYDIEPRTRQIAQMVVSVVNITRSALITAKPDLRRELLRDLAEQEKIEIYPAEPGDRIRTPPEDRPMLSLLSAEIRKHLGDDTRIALERNGERAFWVSFFIDKDEYWVMLPPERVERQLALQWLGWGLLVMVLALCVAYGIVFRLKRPLAQLTGAAAEIGRGRLPAPIDESGPEEVETVARAFNQMTRDLARLEEDRVLMLAGVSHDLRTPLTRLRLAVEMSGSDAPTKEGMTVDIEDMDRIIGQFLDFARASGGEPPQPVDLRALAQEIAERYRHNGQALETDLHVVPVLTLRELAMRRLISNLLDNAYRYAGQGVCLRILTAEDSVRIEVLDRGAGIPAEETERMKQPFTRLEGARSNASGSGLGLAIVERIARMHRGRFDLLPREGGGLIARISLPVQAA